MKAVQKRKKKIICTKEVEVTIFKFSSEKQNDLGHSIWLLIENLKPTQKIYFIHALFL